MKTAWRNHEDEAMGNGPNLAERNACGGPNVGNSGSLFLTP